MELSGQLTSPFLEITHRTKTKQSNVLALYESCTSPLLKMKCRKCHFHQVHEGIYSQFLSNFQQWSLTALRNSSIQHRWIFSLESKI